MVRKVGSSARFSFLLSCLAAGQSPNRSLSWPSTMAPSWTTPSPTPSSGARALLWRALCIHAEGAGVCCFCCNPVVCSTHNTINTTHQNKDGHAPERPRADRRHADDAQGVARRAPRRGRRADAPPLPRRRPALPLQGAVRADGALDPVAPRQEARRAPARVQPQGLLLFVLFSCARRDAICDKQPTHQLHTTNKPTNKPTNNP